MCAPKGQKDALDIFSEDYVKFSVEAPFPFEIVCHIAYSRQVFTSEHFHF